MSGPRFNNSSDRYIFTGSEFRGSDISNQKLRLSQYSNTFIDLCRNAIDISALNVYINNNPVLTSSESTDATLRDLRVVRNTIIYNLSAGATDISSTLNVKGDATFEQDVTIQGNLTITGTTTTINSSVLDISDINITLAAGNSANNRSGANGAGFDICGTNASFRYDFSGSLNRERFVSSIGLGISGDLLPTSNASRVPVSYSTFALKNSGFSDIHLGTEKNTWLTATSYDISKVVLSNYSYIKLEFKVNFISSTEADQTLGFRVERSVTDASWTNVFTDPSLGSNMGVGIISVYNGTFIDNLAGATLNYNNISNNVGYRLRFQRNCPSDDTIDTSFGIIGGSGVGDYIFLQELYRPFL